MRTSVTTWPQFGKNIRKKDQKLLGMLSRFVDPILVTGCQRSGTTILTEVLLQATQIIDYRSKIDSELLGALMLCGELPIPSPGRYCFQTTFLNEKYNEYWDHQGHFKMIFLIRNPFSVVYSMCYHWKRKTQLYNFALNELFDSCGVQMLNEKERNRYMLFGKFIIPQIRKACLSYVGKTSQLFEIKEKLKGDVVIIDYDDLIQKKESVLPFLFDFAHVPFLKSYLTLIHSQGIKRADKLSQAERESVQRTCWGLYERARELAVCF